jgi:hypothetical protein
MDMEIANLIIALNQVGNAVLPPQQPHLLAYQFIESVVHGIPKDILITKPRWTSHNRRLGLENLECSLIVKLKFFLTLGFSERLHECCPPRIGAIRKVVTFVVGVVVCYESSGIPKKHVKSTSPDQPWLQE